MTPAKIARGVLYHVQEIAKGVVTVVAAISVAGSGVWFFIHDQVAATARDLSGTSEIMKGLNAVRTEQADQRVILRDLSARVDSLEPAPAVAVFDKLRSKIDKECSIGKPCHWSYFVRRADTVFGRTCGVPESELVFVDSAGIEYAPKQVSESAPRRLSLNATRVDGDFVVPTGVSLGPGEFFMQLRYSGCGTDGDEKIQAETMRLVTTIVENGK